jgi:ubiquinone/menaquinone biosynthesis C-methylase UbiE
MRATWDALAAAETEVYVGDPARARTELESLFSRLGADPQGGTCIEVGCGPGRMTGALAERFDEVVAVDVSPLMITRAQAAVPAPNVRWQVVPGERLEGVEDESGDVVVCYLVLQHLPKRRAVLRYLSEFARVLKRGGQGFVQLPVLEPGLRPRLWRTLRSALVPVAGAVSRNPARASAFRGFRLTGEELIAGLEAAGLRVTARDEGPDAPYRFSRDVFLRLERA